MTWEQLCKDKRFEDAPYKIESNAQGQIIMSPTWNYHGSNSYRIARLIEEHLGEGEVIVECAVETADGTKEADVAWLSEARWAEVAEDFSCKIAPEICVEVLSPSNTEKEMLYKKDLYLAAGALEYWLCDKAGHMRFFDRTGEVPKSSLVPEFPAMLPKR
ncbi:MAG TPA: Uma2 family endonuclease [Chthoniobacteraceae bacterium]|jgi:Uma2 family endonuclease